MGHAGNPGFQQHEHGRSEQRPKKITGAAQYGHQYGLGRHGPMHKFRAGYTQERRHQSARQTRKSARQRKRRQAIAAHVQSAERDARSEEHTSELQSLMSNSYAVFCLKKKTYKNIHNIQPTVN